MAETLLLCDSNALIHRAYHAFPKTLSTKDGKLTNAAFGFTKLLLQSIKKFQPKYIICAFDSPGKTFRHDQFDLYKATRKPTDRELIEQFPITKQIVDALNIPLIEMPGYEADDIIGSIAKSAEFANIDKVIVTGDRDLLQLVDAKTKVYLAGSSFAKAELLDEQGVVRKMGITPLQVIEYKGLRGDSSDNIPGVRGVGEVTASELLSDFGNLEEIYANLENVKPAVAKKLTEQKDMAFLSRTLATIKTDLTNIPTQQQAILEDFNSEKTVRLFIDLQFNSIIKDLPKAVPAEIAKKSDQLGLLFGDAEPDAVATLVVIAPAKLGPEVTLLPTTTGEGPLAQIEKLIAVDTSGAYLLDHSDVKQLAAGLKGKKLATKNTKQFLHAVKNSTGEWLDIAFDLDLAHYIVSGGYTLLDEAEMVQNYAQEPFDGNYALYNKVYKVLASQIDANHKLKNLYYQVELPLVVILAKMEQAGIGFDINHITVFGKELDDKIAVLTASIYSLVGYEFNIASGKQLGEALFDKLGLPSGKRTKTGSYATNEQTLITLTEHEVVRDVLSYKEAVKLRSTYTTSLINLVNKSTGRIHTNYNQLVAATGRLSSVNPNLQNIPISSEDGMQIRRTFIASKGKALMFFDYSQQELRLLAHLSGDANLMQAFSSGIDIHSLTASKVFDKSVDEVSKDERRAGKTINFGIVYGISGFGLSERLQIPVNLGQEYIDAFYTNYIGVKQYFDKLVADAGKTGRVESILGRFRAANGLNSTDFRVRQATYREVINFPLQASASDMMKQAMVLVDAVLQNYPQARVLLQIHDELVLEVEDSVLKDEQFTQDIKDAMLSGIKLNVPMQVDVEMGYNLSDKSKLTFTK